MRVADTKKTTATKQPASTTKKTTSTKKPATKKTTTATKQPSTTKKTTSTAKKPSTTKKAVPASTKKTSTTVKKTTATKPAAKSTTSTPKKSSATKKPVVSSTKKPASTTPSSTGVKKQTVKASSVKPKATTTKKPTPKKSPSKEKVTAAEEKKEVKKLTPSNAPRKVKKKKEVKPRVKKTAKQIQEEIVSKEAVESIFEDKTKKKSPLGKRFYLFFSLFFYAGAFFYINSAVYDNNDYLQSAMFAFALLMFAFLLLYFNIHMILIKFFKLPLDYLLEQAKLEYRKDLIVEDEQTGIRKRIGRYRTIFTLVLYILVFLGLVGSQVYNGIIDGDRVIVIVTQSLSTGLVYLLILCAWQYIFNIIPNLLENSIDAKSGFILTLSALILIVYVFFMMFNIAFLEEVMIFILIIGFILLLGVNLNMIVGEFNIFKNLKNRKGKSKAVTRMVFLIFFSFHLYIMIYASIVAFSIYDQNNDTYVFGNKEYDITLVDNVQFNGSTITSVYNQTSQRITKVYYEDGREIVDFYEHGAYVTDYYNYDGSPIDGFYMFDGTPIDIVTKGDESYPAYQGVFASQYFVYYQGTLKGVEVKEVQHGYSDLLYYAVITISSIGYGDIHPNTNYLLPQFWGGFLSIYGITFYALSIGYVSNIAFMGVTDTKESEQDDQ
jgi:hypothetical protein